MKSRGAFWLFLLCGSLDVEATVDWSCLKEQLLVSSKVHGAAKSVSKNWYERPIGFFNAIPKDSWEIIIPLLSTAKIASISGEELRNNWVASQAFARYLPKMFNTATLPGIFRLAVYEFLMDTEASKVFSLKAVDPDFWLEIDGPNSLASLEITIPDDSNPPKELPSNIILGQMLYKNDAKLTEVTNSIPPAWVKHDGELLVKVLTRSKPPRLASVSNDTLSIILSNPKNICKVLTIEALRSLSLSQLDLMKPECMAIIDGLENLNVWTSFFPSNVFAAYNGPLTKHTISLFSDGQARMYGLQISLNQPICQSLDVGNLPGLAFWSLTSRCLHGYFSQPQVKRLGNLWQMIRPSTLMQFTPEMQLSWKNIHPEDFNEMPSIIFNLITASLEKSEITVPWIMKLFTESKGPFKFEKLWQEITHDVAINFGEKMMNALGKVDLTDLAFMPPWVIQVVLRSKAVLKNLANRLEPSQILLSLNEATFTRDQFAAIAKAAPDLAGQLLILMYEPPNDILADCDGQVIRSLNFKIQSMAKLDWKSLLKALAKKSDSFSQIVRHMSTGTGNHFCATINSFEEYLSLTWLRNNMQDDCRSVLTFDPNDVFIPARAPELFKGDLPWRSMLERYTIEDWTRVSRYTKISKALGNECEFWGMVNDKYSNIFPTIHQVTLSRISPICTRLMGNVIRKNPNLIPLLADAAFSMHRAGELPCQLKYLSPRQIQKLSEGNSVNPKSPTDEEIAEHAISHISLEELKPLGYQQFKIVVSELWKYVPDGIKVEALKWHFQLVGIHLNGFFSLKVHDKDTICNLDVSPGTQDAKSFQDAWELYESIRQLHKDFPDTLNWECFISGIRNSRFRDSFVGKFSQASWSEPIALALARNSEELRFYLGVSIEKMDSTMEGFQFAIKPGSGFDRPTTITLIEKYPKFFALPYAFVDCEEFEDDGGVIRMLISQLLGDIQRDLITPGPEPPNFKFTWGISREVGLLVGIIFGKAVQEDIRLPFPLDLNFYYLIVDNSDGAIEKYYRATYGKEILEFERVILAQRAPDLIPNQNLLDVLTRLDKIRFTKISLEADLEKAKADFGAKTNIWSCGDREGFEDPSELVGVKLEEYLRELFSKIMVEFKHFVREFVRGLGYTIRPVKEFINIPSKALHAFPQLLPNLLNAKPLGSRKVIEKISFFEDKVITAFLQDELILASNIVSTFITSLSEKQLGQLLAIWTGSSTISLDYATLEVSFFEPERIELVKLNFCEPWNSNMAGREFTIAPGKEYKDFFGRFVKKISGTSHGIEPDCDPEGVGIIPIKISTCSSSLRIPLQSAQKMFNSLVDLMNTPLTAVRDNLSW